MDQYATVALGGPRWQPLFKTIRFVGFDLTGADFRLQVRLGLNTPGAPLIDLLKVGTAAAEGVRLIGVEEVDGQTISSVGVRINEATMEGLPFMGESGDSSVLAWDMQVTPVGGYKAKWIGGDFIVEGAVTGADGALSAGSGYSGRSFARAGAGSSVFQIGETVILVSMAGGQGPRGEASGPLGSESVGAEEINGSDVVALQDKLGITGQVVTLTANTTLASFEPRPGDAFNLNGKTLTIGRMADTRLTNLFRGAGSVVIQSGLARPGWWQANSYRAAALAVMAGGGGRVELDPARYASESTVADPMPLSNVRFVGAGKPAFGPGFQALTGGTILDGPVVFGSRDGAGNALGNNVGAESLGVDSGAVVCGSGPAREGLFLPNIGQIVGLAQREGIAIRDIRVLCRDAAAPVHAILIEKSLNAIIESVETVYGENGFVDKGQYTTFRKARCRGHATNPGIIKSDVYSTAIGCLWEDVTAGTITGNDCGPFRIQAASASTAGHTMRDVRVNGATGWISQETYNDFNMTDITIAGGSSEATVNGSLTIAHATASGTGRIARVTVLSARINNVQTAIEAADFIGNAIYIGPNVSTVNIQAVQITNTARDGIRNKGADVVVTGSTALVAGTSGLTSFGFNGVAGSMKVPANSNIGTTSPSIVA